MRSLAKSFTRANAALFAIAAVTAMSFTTLPGSAAGLVDLSADGKTQLRQLLRPHIPQGKFVSRAARAATGDPDITVIDRRTGGVSRCSFLNQGNKRVLLCES